MTEYFELLRTWLDSAHPAILPLALVVLPLIPFPVSALFLLIAARYSLPAAILICLLGLAGNQSLAYFLARFVGRSLLERILSRFKRSVPQTPLRDAGKFILLIRVTPGIPLFVQNYLLGLSGVPFLKYLLFSIPVTFSYALVFILFGAAAFSGKIGWTLTGILGASALFLALQLWRKRFQARVCAEVEDEAATLPASEDTTVTPP